MSVVAQGELTLRTARLTLAYASENGIDINRIDASGGVTVTSPSETARGDFAVYDLDDGLITMVGNVRLERGGSLLSGGAADDRPRHRPRGDGRRPARREPGAAAGSPAASPSRRTQSSR